MAKKNNIFQIVKFLERNGYNYHITKITKKKIKEYIHLPINEEIIEEQPVFISAN